MDSSRFLLSGSFQGSGLAHGRTTGLALGRGFGLLATSEGPETH